MASFRDVLKPGSLRTTNKHNYYLRPVLRLGRKVVWRGDEAFAHDASKMKYDDLAEMVRDEAERVLHCDCGSLMAEQLQRAVDTGEPVP